MDLNLVVVCGSLVTDPEIRSISDSVSLRMLIKTTRHLPNRRIDVLPVTLWNPAEELLDELPRANDRIWTVGSLQRRFWQEPAQARSRLEIVAEQVTVQSDEVEDESCLEDA